MTIDAISSIGVNLAMDQDISLTNQAHPTSANFAELINRGLGELNNEINSADKLMVDYALNKNVSTHELMIAMEKAKHSMQLAVEVRNRLVEAYQKVTSMQV